MSLNIPLIRTHIFRISLVHLYFIRPTASWNINALEKFKIYGCSYYGIFNSKSCTILIILYYWASKETSLLQSDAILNIIAAPHQSLSYLDTAKQYRSLTISENTKVCLCQKGENAVKSMFEKWNFGIHCIFILFDTLNLWSFDVLHNEY